MAAKRGSSRRGPPTQFRKLARAGVIDPNEFRRKRDGTLTKASEKRIAKIWDSVGALIANPDARPFHTYKPREKAGLRRIKAAIQAGIDPEFARIKGVKGVPILAPRGAKRVRFPKGGGISFEMGEGAAVKRSRFRPFSAKNLAKNPTAYGKMIEASLAKAGGWRIRTGAGWYSPGGSLAAAIQYLAESYDDADEWMDGVELVEFWDE